MSISQYIKKIGRGSKGASDLTREEARDLFEKILHKKVSDLERGAFCLAMRMKGETSDELLGFMDALDSQILNLPLGTRPTIILPSYNGARKQVNLVPLLAIKLQQAGWQVIVHGVTGDPSRLTTFAIWEQLGWPILQAHQTGNELLELGLPIFCPIQVLSPSLFELLQIRNTLGLRNTGHVLAKLINPFRNQKKDLPIWQISNYTHPEYPKVLDQFFISRKVNAILMRGNEGEPVASVKRLPKLTFLTSGGSVRELPEIYFSDDIHIDSASVTATAEFTQLAFNKPANCPSALQAQINAIMTHTDFKGSHLR